MCSCPKAGAAVSHLEFPILNRLLVRLSADARARLGTMERVEFALRDTLETAGEPIEYAYFPETGLASVILESPSAGSIEVGMIGVEGMTGLGIVEGDTQTPFTTFIQGIGSGHVIPAGRLRAALDESTEIRQTFLRFSRSFSIQVASTAFANGHSKLEARLARWLLMVGDRMGPSFSVTHEFLGMMLAVRRSGVTLALQILEGKGLIRSTRGAVAIIDRAGLIEHAGGVYGLAEREYQRLLA
jgi:CRP-like cAMP-binding protein